MELLSHIYVHWHVRKICVTSGEISEKPMNGNLKTWLPDLILKNKSNIYINVACKWIQIFSHCSPWICFCDASGLLEIYWKCIFFYSFVQDELNKISWISGNFLKTEHLLILVGKATTCTISKKIYFSHFWTGISFQTHHETGIHNVAKSCAISLVTTCEQHLQCSKQSRLSNVKLFPTHSRFLCLFLFFMFDTLSSLDFAPYNNSLYY